jgi:hypothetical protein
MPQFRLQGFLRTWRKRIEEPAEDARAHDDGPNRQWLISLIAIVGGMWVLWKVL